MISLILPRCDSAHFVGTVVPLLGGFIGIQAKLYKPEKPKEDIHSPFETGPPKDCIYDGDTEKNSDNIWIPPAFLA